MHSDGEEHWYSIHGRIRRIQWVMRVFGGGAAMVCAVLLLSVLAPHDRHGGASALLTVPLIGLVLGFVVFRFIQDIKRLHDLGKSGIWLVCAFIPLVNLIYVCFLIFADGQPYPNEFGPDPKGRGSDIEGIADVFR